ncbi:hypothetical protein HDU79_004137 [Rhizoclosmatium sp. JEL0117]|nr:hypothetical protein HDU79_004137 [Rhizoclosmatium sp. JEL0117]
MTMKSSLAILILSAVTYDVYAKQIAFENYFNGVNLKSNQATTATVSTPLLPPANITVWGPNASQKYPPVVLTGLPVKIYNIFYGNFSQLEQDRINNYAQHVSDTAKSSVTFPARWTVATQYYDTKGVYVNPVLTFGGSVYVSAPTAKYINGTTASVGNPSSSGMAKIIESFVGQGKAFGRFDSQAIYCLLTSPDILNSDYDPKSGIPYGGYHFTYTTKIDGKPVNLGHAFAHTIGMNATKVDFTQSPNGDTGRRVVDPLIDIMHHEIFEHVSDPYPNTAWTDNPKSPAYGIGEVGDACEYSNNRYPGLRYTISTSKRLGRWYNTVINGQIYALQDIWTYDTSGVQGCYASVNKPVDFLGPKKASSVVTVIDGLSGYTGITLPCRAFYIQRYYGGWSIAGSSVCTIYLAGGVYGYDGNNYPAGPLAIKDNFHLVQKYNSVNANYHWAAVNETTASRTFYEGVGPAPATVSEKDSSVFVVIDDNWVNSYPAGSSRWTMVDQGAIYFCRALYNKVWYVGETNKNSKTCDVQVNGVLQSVKKDGINVHFLLRNPFCDPTVITQPVCSEDGRVATCSSTTGVFSYTSCSTGKTCQLKSIFRNKMMSIKLVSTAVCA